MDKGLLKIEDDARVLSLGRSKTYQLVMEGRRHRSGGSVAGSRVLSS
jgi:hypothetical protein